VPFVEKNVAADRQAAMEMIHASGQQGVPVIIVDGQPVVGFNQPRLRELLAQAQRTQPSKGPKLGAAVADAVSQRHKIAGIPASGAYVGRVRPGSAAERAGLRTGDVITALGGQKVGGATDIDRLVSQLPPGRDVLLTYVRDGQERSTPVRL
jgi:S1-C subfamily serine protease